VWGRGGKRKKKGGSTSDHSSLKKKKEKVHERGGPKKGGTGFFSLPGDPDGKRKRERDGPGGGGEVFRLCLFAEKRGGEESRKKRREVDYSLCHSPKKLKECLRGKKKRNVSITLYDRLKGEGKKGGCLGGKKGGEVLACDALSRGGKKEDEGNRLNDFRGRGGKGTAIVFSPPEGERKKNWEVQKKKKGKKEKRAFVASVAQAREEREGRGAGFWVKGGKKNPQHPFSGAREKKGTRMVKRERGKKRRY